MIFVHPLLCACCTLIGCTTKIMIFQGKIVRQRQIRPAYDNIESKEAENVLYIVLYDNYNIVMLTPFVEIGRKPLFLNNRYKTFTNIRF